MKEGDGIAIADRPTWALSFRELKAILGKRIIALPSKLIGFKPFCLFLATWLLVAGKIDMWVWFLVFVSVLFGVVGLKVAMRYREAEVAGGGDGGIAKRIGAMAGGCSDGAACGARVSGDKEPTGDAGGSGGGGEGG